MHTRAANRRDGRSVRLSGGCTPGMGVNLWGESPLNVNPVNVLCTFAQVLAEGKGGTVMRFALRVGPSYVSDIISFSRQNRRF